jgi:hypothetical protein
MAPGPGMRPAAVLSRHIGDMESLRLLREPAKTYPAEEELVSVPGDESSPLGSRRGRHGPALWVCPGRRSCGATRISCAVFAISRGTEVNTYIFRNLGGTSFPIPLIAGTILAYFEVRTARLFDAPPALC